MNEIAVFPTLTAAQRSARQLRQNGIAAEVVKVDSSRTRFGCAWGVAFPARYRAAAEEFFARSCGPREILTEE